MSFRVDQTGDSTEGFKCIKVLHKFPESHFTMKDPPLYFDSLQKNLNKTDMMEIHCVDEFDNVSGDFNDRVVTQVLITELS